MRNRKGNIRCEEGQVLLEVISEKDEKMVQDFTCIEPGSVRSSMGRYCVPKADSKYIACQTYECPAGYYPMGIHMEDTESGRSGLGFSCVPAGEVVSSRMDLEALAMYIG